MNVGGIAAHWGQMTRPRQVASRIVTASALLLAIGAVGLTLRDRAVWGKVLTGVGAACLGAGLALCCWRPAQAMAPAPQDAPPAEPAARVEEVFTLGDDVLADIRQRVDRRVDAAWHAALLRRARERARPLVDAVKHADRWVAQLAERGPATAERLEQELAELVAECQGYRDRLDGGLDQFSSETGAAMGRRYLQVYPAEQARWHFLRHVAANAALRVQFVEHDRLGFSRYIWSVLHRHRDGSIRLTHLQTFIGSEDWRQNGDLLPLRPQLAAFELITQLKVWFFNLGDRPSQCDTALGLREIMRFAAPALWPEAAVAAAPEDHPFNVHVFRFAEGISIREQDDANRERIILHIADSLATLMRVMHEDSTLSRGAMALGELAQRLMDGWPERQEVAVARIEQGETGLLEQIAAVTQAP